MAASNPLRDDSEYTTEVKRTHLNFRLKEKRFKCDRKSVTATTISYFLIKQECWQLKEQSAQSNFTLSERSRYSRTRGHLSYLGTDSEPQEK